MEDVQPVHCYYSL